MLDTVTSRVGIRRLKAGNPQLSTLEAAARSDVRQSQDVFNALKSGDLDNAEGLLLDRIGRDEKVPRLLLRKATGSVTITDTSFAKKSTKVYQGTAAPIIGSAALNVEDTTAWPSTGSVYVGRNTPNVEGPLTYTSITPHGSYFTLNLSGSTARFHNLGETVVLAQGGDRIVDAGSVVQTAQGALASAVQFSTVFEVRVPDGEVEVDGVQVVAALAGALGNIPKGAVQSFVGSGPFAGAAVTNDKPFVTGRDTETDNDYRDRIRAARNSKQRGTDLAITGAVVGAFSPDESKTVTSAKLVRRAGQASVLYVDDGTGYEEVPQGVGIEVLVDSALGGESEFQTLNRPVSKAFIVSQASAPYSLADGIDLSVDVGGVTTTHSFDATEFQAVGSASAYEVVASINADGSLLWGARTAGSGTRVVLFAKAETGEDIQVAVPPGTDASPVFNFATSRRFTTLLYKNDHLLSKDGAAASVASLKFETWNSFASSQTLVLAVDSTPAVTYTFTDQNFVDAVTGYSAVGKNSLAAWVAVVNAKVPGVTATSENDSLVLTSNLGRSGRAAVAVVGGTLITNHVFDVSASTGKSNDYTVDRGTGQVVLNTGLTREDRLTLGSAWTRAFLETAQLSPTSLPDVDTWWAVDGSAQIVPHGVGQATPLTSTVESVTTRARRMNLTATSTSPCFDNVMQGDWAVLWDTDFPASLQNAWRVVGVKQVSGLNNRLVLEKRASAQPRFQAACVALIPVSTLAKILVTGGYTHSNSISGSWTHTGDAVTEEVELYDPNTGSWTAVAPMIHARAYHTATTLQSGKVLVVGGYDHDGNTQNTTEVYDPVANTWTAGPTLVVARAEHTATLLNNGRVLIAGGLVSGNTPTATCVEYDPTGNNFVNSTSMGAARAGHGAVLLPAGAGTAGAEAGNVLVVGGISGSFTLATAERYSAGSPGWTAKASMGAGHERGYFGLAVVNTQKVLAVGDSNAQGYSSDQRGTYQVYSVDTNTWTASATVEAGWRFQDKMGGLVKSPTNPSAVAHGCVFVSGTTKVARSKRFDGNTLTWSTLAASPADAFVCERTGLSAVAVTGGPSPDRTWFYGGVSENNSRVIDDTSGPACATSVIWNDDTSSWEVPDPSLTLSSGTISHRGLTFVRTQNALQHLLIPAAANYTSQTLAAVLNAGLQGVVSAAYRTSKLRVQTASFSVGDDLLLAAKTDDTFPVPAGVPVENVVGHFASVRASNTGLGTPDAFQVHDLIGAAGSPHVQDAAETIFGAQYVNAPQQTHPMETSTLVGLRRWYDGVTPRDNPTGSVAEFGNTKNVRAAVATIDTAGSAVVDRVRYGLRTRAEQEWVPGIPAVFAQPYAVGPRDDLTVVVDQDTETKRFVTPMFRRCAPSGSYGSQITLNDADASGVVFAKTFGKNYDFNDFAVYMKARAVSHNSILWRYFRHGPEGERAVVRYTYPTVPNSAITVTLEYGQTTATNFNLAGDPLKFFVDVQLASGAARTANVLNPTTSMALARTNGGGGVYLISVIVGYSIVEGQRTAAGAHTRLRVQIPNTGSVAFGAQDSGINPGDVLYYKATAGSPTTLFSGSFTVEAVDAFDGVTGQQNIYVPPNTLHDGTSAWGPTSNPGNLSLDTQGEASFDPAATTGDLLYLAPGSLPGSFTGTTIRTSIINHQSIIGVGLDLTGAGPLTTPVTTVLSNPADVSLFAGSSKTQAQIAAAVNALCGDGLPSPVSATLLNSGTSTVTLASWDEMSTIRAGYFLTDGVNYVQRTIAPPDTVTATQFLLKRAVSVFNGLDWANEDVRIAPLLAQDVVQWLNTPAVTGLSSVAEVVAAVDGTTVQLASLTPGTDGAVEVEGGTADLTTAAVVGGAALNSRGGVGDTMIATIRRSEADGLVGGRWVSIDNESAQSKTPFIVPSNNVTSITAAGKWSFDVAPYTVLGKAYEARVVVEKIGNFIAVHVPNCVNGDVGSFKQGLNLNQGVEYGYVYITTDNNTSNLPDISLPNRGVFRVVRFTGNTDGNTIWIENPNAVEEASLCRIKMLSAASAVPGDSWSVSTADFGVNNRGSWQVTEVGAATPGGEQFVDLSFVTSAPDKTSEAHGTQLVTARNAGGLQLRQGTPSRMFKQVLSVAPNQTDPNLMDVQLDTSEGFGDVGASAGSVVTALDKLAFPAGIQLGVDGYSYATGLLNEVNRIVYGDPAAPSTYPGYASAGADILPSGPTVKRVKVALSLRVVSGLPSEDLGDRVRSAVAAVINQAGVGQAVAISDIVAAAGKVGGVVAVAIVSPTFSSTSDVIPVGAGEKLLVLDLRNDVQVSFVGA